MDNFNKQIKKYHTLYTEGPIWNKVKNAAGAAGRGVKNAAGAAGTRVWDTAKTNAKEHLQNWKDEATRGGKNLLRGVGEVGLGLMGIPNLGILKYQKAKSDENPDVEKYEELIKIIQTQTTLKNVGPPVNYNVDRLFDALPTVNPVTTPFNRILGMTIRPSKTITYDTLKIELEKYFNDKRTVIPWVPWKSQTTIDEFKVHLQSVDFNQFSKWLNDQLRTARNAKT